MDPLSALPLLSAARKDSNRLGLRWLAVVLLLGLTATSLLLCLRGASWGLGVLPSPHEWVLHYLNVPLSSAY